VTSSPAIGSDGTVYVGEGGRSGNKLYAIKTDSKGLAKSPWPMRGQNPQHTGRVVVSASPEPPPVAAVGQLMEQAAQGDVEAQVKLGHAYDYGEGVPKNPAEAMKWYRKAAFQGDDMAQYNVAASLALGEGIPAPDKVSA
jgi:TPR repeat protein